VAGEGSVYNTDGRMPKEELARMVIELEKQMKAAAKALEFEKAAALRDQVVELRRALISDVESLQELEQAARDGRLATLPRFGDKTAQKILKGIADLRSTGAFVLWQHGRAEAARLREAVAAHPDVLQVEIAGSIHRRAEVVRDIDLVAAVRGAPSVVAASALAGYMAPPTELGLLWGPEKYGTTHVPLAADNGLVMEACLGAFRWPVLPSVGSIVTSASRRIASSSSTSSSAASARSLSLAGTAFSGST